jgi:hypothetical protein
MSNPTETLPTPIQIGSFVHAIRPVFGRHQNGDFVQLKPGEKFEVTSLGHGSCILQAEGQSAGPRILAQVADLQVW